MVKISILYPHSPNARFDFDYYTRRHMPRSLQADMPNYTDIAAQIQVNEILIESNATV